MWEINFDNQVLTAALSAGIGVCLCLFYDLLRAVRDYKRFRYIIVFCLDLLFWTVAALVMFSFFQLYSNGKPRLYSLIFSAAGFLFCRLTFSAFFVRMLKKLMRQVTKVLTIIRQIITACSSFINSIFSIILKLFEKPINKGINKTKKLLKNHSKIVYNNTEKAYGIKICKRLFKHGGQKEKGKEHFA